MLFGITGEGKGAFRMGNLDKEIPAEISPKAVQI